MSDDKYCVINSTQTSVGNNKTIRRSYFDTFEQAEGYAGRLLAKYRTSNNPPTFLICKIVKAVSIAGPPVAEVPLSDVTAAPADDPEDD